MFEVLAPLSLLPLVALGAMHLKVKGSSVLIHFGSHRMGLADPRANRVASELVGVLTLNVSLAAYHAEHSFHHGLKTFARAGLDPDASLLHQLGFRPGMAASALWRHLAATLLSPRFHALLSVARLRAVFAAGSAWRRALAWLVWGALTGGAVQADLGLAFLLGFVLPLLVFGNAGALLELASEHRFSIGGVDGRERQAQLSHARLLGAMPPRGLALRSLGAWLLWAARMAAALAARIAVLPGDLSHHDVHHIGLRPALRVDAHGWTNAAYAYSPLLWDESSARRHRMGSIRQAIGHWFESLSQEKPESPRA